MTKLVSTDNKTIARTLATAFGVKPTVRAYWDDTERFSVDILSCPNPVSAEVIEYGTIGLSDHPIYSEGKILDFRLEVVCTAQRDFVFVPNLLSTVAFTIIKDKWLCTPGAVLMDVLEMYDASLMVKHLYFTAPGLWGENLETQELTFKNVTWLHAIPITDTERQYLLDYGDEALENKFEEGEVDISDLNRQSLV